MPIIAWETSLFNGCTHTQGEICNPILEGKSSSKGLTSTKSEEKPQKVLIVASFEGDDEKA